MSHVMLIDVVVRDLDALEVAAVRCGLELRRGQRTFRWYGRWMNDFHATDAAFRHGVPPESYGTCEHALAIPGDAHAYEVGLIRAPDGRGFRLLWDGWDRRLEPLIGASGGRLMQQYAVAATRREAARRGHQVRGEVILPDGTIRLTLKVPVKF